MCNWLKDMLSSKSGLSSKRFITFGAFTLMAIAFLSNLFFNLTIEEFMYETMSYVVIGGLGFTASEFFAGKKQKEDKVENISENPDGI